MIDPLRERLPSVISLKYSTVPFTTSLEFACINQLGCGFTVCKRTLLASIGNHSSTITL